MGNKAEPDMHTLIALTLKTGQENSYDSEWIHKTQLAWSRDTIQFPKLVGKFIRRFKAVTGFTLHLHVYKICKAAEIKEVFLCYWTNY